MKLFHVSETTNIDCFEPRPDQSGVAVVWAIDQTHLPNYLLPRDCPRICVRRGACEDISLMGALLGTAKHVIYVEYAWQQRIASASLFVFEFDASPFVCVDANAGYYQATSVVRAFACNHVTEIEQSLIACNVELRYVDTLLPIQSAVIDSQLAYSCIRMRNARNAAQERLK